MMVLAAIVALLNQKKSNKFLQTKKQNNIMALQKNIRLIDNFGIEVEIPNVYIKINKVECSKENSSCSVVFKKSKDSTDFIKVDTNSFNFNLTSSDNAIKQAYLHLKTLPEFSDAVDC